MHAHILLAAAALAFSATLHAQGAHDSHDSHAGHADHGAAASAPADAMATGEVRKIDRAQGSITLRHGPLPNLGMGAMTMVFRVPDAALLDRVNERDKVRFMAARIDGALTLVALEPGR